MMTLGILALAGLSLAATTAQTTLEVPELADMADRVVLGEVRAMHTEPTGPGIETVVELSVRDTLLGTPASVVTFRLPGGELDGIELTVSGTPQLSLGDEVLVFLTDAHLVAAGQGAFYLTDGVAWRPQAPLALPLDEIRREVR